MKKYLTFKNILNEGSQAQQGAGVPMNNYLTLSN